MNNEKIYSMLSDVELRLIESTHYTMKKAECHILDCVDLIRMIKRKVKEDSTDTI